MAWALAIAVAWAVLALPAGILIGLKLRRADRVSALPVQPEHPGAPIRTDPNGTGSPEHDGPAIPADPSLGTPGGAAHSDRPRGPHLDDRGAARQTT